jgi:protease II
MSPDGKMVAYTTNDDSTELTKVVVRPTDSQTPSAILDIWPTRIFKWLPDGTGLFYQERHRGENRGARVFKITLGNRNPEFLLSTEPDEIFDLSYSRDGKRFALVKVKLLTDAVMLTDRSDGASPTR